MPLNKEALLQVADAIETDMSHPFDMRLYSQCISGWAIRLFELGEGSRSAANFLGLNEWQYEKLFFRHYDWTRSQAATAIREMVEENE